MNQPSFYKLFSGTVVGYYGINVLGIAVEVSKKASLHAYIKYKREYEIFKINETIR